MFKIFEIRGKRFEYSNNIRAQKLSNPNPNIRDFEEKDSNPNRIRIYSITSVKHRLQVCSTLYSTTFNNSESYQAAPLTLGAVSTFVFLAFFLFLVILPPSGLGFI